MAPGSGTSPEAGQAAEIVSEAVQVFLGELQRYHDWTVDPDTKWDAENLVDQISLTSVAVLPVIARSVDFGLELLRPWSQAFEKRVNDA